MNNPDLKEFENLITHYFMDDLSQEESEKLLQYINSSSECRDEYDRMVKMRARLFVPYFESRKEANYKYLSFILGLKQKRFFWRVGMRRLIPYAAAILLCITVSSLSIWWYKQSLPPSSGNLFVETVVPVGSQAKIKLPDGTLVNINSGSTLTYNDDFEGLSRIVHLQGEAYFDVAENEGKPFIVNTGSVEVKVLGTEFNVKSYTEDNTVEVSLIEGIVDVLAHSFNSYSSTRLEPNECFIYDKEDNTFQINKMDAYKAGLWTSGKISFVNQTLHDVLKDLERRYDVQIVVESNNLDEEYFTGNINAGYTIEKLLELLDVDNKYKWNRQGNTITIYDK